MVRAPLVLRSKQRMEFFDMTEPVRDAAQKHLISDGIVLANSLHTTVALFVTEFRDALAAPVLPQCLLLIRAEHIDIIDVDLLPGCVRTQDE